jgi:hypothetical protein
MWKNMKWKIPTHQWQLNHFEVTYTLDGYIFVLTPPNNMVIKYVKYKWYVRKRMVLSYYFAMFSCIFITQHHFKYYN